MRRETRMTVVNAATRARRAVARVVILPYAGDTAELDYALDGELPRELEPGMRVLVPLGRRRAVGIVTELARESSYPKLKNVVAVLDAQPALDEALLSLCRWMADYYLGSLAEAISTALPGSARMSVERVVRMAGDRGQGGDGEQVPERLRAVLDWIAQEGTPAMKAVERRFGPRAYAAVGALRKRGLLLVEDRIAGGEAHTRRLRYYRAARALDADERGHWQRRRPATYALFAYLADHPLRQARLSELATSFPQAAAKLRALVKDGLVAYTDEEVYREVLPDRAPEDRPVAPNGAQLEAIGHIEHAIENGFQPFLLWGVTGSGKTEVYLRCIAACLQRQRGAIVLVPEISLTHQLVDRVRARFGDRVAVLHSDLSDGERWDEWRKISRGEVSIVVGARSAVFAPLPRLGLIVVDEEHDSAYKQEDGLRYNGRDVAVMRAKLANCPVVLGSATPAMESYFNGHSGRYRVLRLEERVEARPLPSVDIVDLRRTPSAGRAVLVSQQLLAALKANLAGHGQSLIFLNRRGFANFLQCHQCGDVPQCPNCSVTLTLHKKSQALRCHHCDHTLRIPTACRACGGLSLGVWGAGTEQVEAALKQLLPNARIGRMDRDTTARKGSQRRILVAWERQEYDVLVGTQMITKGHDIPGVTLVGVVLADLSLNFPDFRAAERTFQLLTQVAGRAGRGERPGTVIVQTMQPKHFSLACAQHHDYQRFAELELGSRRELGYPPFARFVLIRCEGEAPAATEATARAVAEHVRAHARGQVGVLGPTPAPLERLRRRYRWQILLRSKSAARLHSAAAAARESVRAPARKTNVRVLVDVDPYSML
jgi:primosomal protein N' (replication factor Y)